MHVGGYPIIAVVDSGSEATILAHELFNKLATSNIKMLLIPITGAVLISAWGKLKLRLWFHLRIVAVILSTFVL
jgi:hypothetical protein